MKCNQPDDDGREHQREPRAMTLAWYAGKEWVVSQGGYAPGAGSKYTAAAMLSEQDAQLAEELMRL